MEKWPMNVKFKGNNLFAEMDSGDLSKLEFFKLTPQRFREVVFAKRISSGPGFNVRYMPSTRELDNIVNALTYAVHRGQVIDFGYWPNEFIKMTSSRAGPMYIQGATGHPFRTPWVFMHSWNDPIMERNFDYPATMNTSAYLVNPFPDDGQPPLGCDTEVVELHGMKVQGWDLLTVGDRGLLMADDEPDADGEFRYNCQLSPMVDRFRKDDGSEYMKDLVANHERYHGEYKQAAAGNLFDPFVTALLLLNTRGVNQETILASEKLNKARAKTGKPLIPPYRKVNSDAYVTAVLTRRHHGSHAPGDGSRKSPVAHIRSGHWRHYKSGDKSFIMDTLVKATEEMRQLFRATRSHYKID